METIAFRMKLKVGQAETYRKRHDEIWPDLIAALKKAGVSDYRIFLDPETYHLFAILTRPRNHGMGELPKSEVMQRWWAFMADIMESGPNNVPAQVELKPVFYMP
jgi:L-rhamnose mutarotase